MDKKLAAKRAVQIIPATGWYALFRDAEHVDGEDGGEPTHILHETHQPLVCWALSVDGDVGGRISYIDGCVGDPRTLHGFVHYVYMPDGPDDEED